MQLNKVDIVVGELLVRRLKLFFKETLFYQHVNSCDEGEQTYRRKQLLDKV